MLADTWEVMDFDAYGLIRPYKGLTTTYLVSARGFALLKASGKPGADKHAAHKWLATTEAAQQLNVSRKELDRLAPIAAKKMPEAVRRVGEGEKRTRWRWRSDLLAAAVDAARLPNSRRAQAKEISETA